MRITGGELKGRHILVPPGIIRPAMDRMRESIFNIIQPIEGLSFLDLFSGSGIMALEAYSRGARPVRAVEKDRGKKEIISRNLELAGPDCRLSLMPAERFVMASREAFDLIFLDPPFPYRHKADLLLRLARSKLVHPNSLIMIHYPDSDRLPDSLPAPGLQGFIPEIFRGDSTPPAQAQDMKPCEFRAKDQRAFGRSQLRFYHVPLDTT